jgi:hypothetical protein
MGIRSYSKYLVVEAHPHAPGFVDWYHLVAEFKVKCLLLRGNNG